MIDIQVQMSERAIELLALPDDEPRFLLDLGCGSGLSGSVLEDWGHMWVGIDISSAMLGMFLQIMLWPSSVCCQYAFEVDEILCSGISK